MHSVKDVLKKFNPLKDKYVSREFQAFGVNLAERLEDPRRKGLYIKFAKTVPRPLLEMALRFVIDANAKNKAALFMWKLKEMGAFPSAKSKTQSSNAKQSSKTKVLI
ncbi:MAG: hypothetical protein WAT72_03400 [Microgenomates group bacterium]|jgi:hypothetical protein